MERTVVAAAREEVVAEKSTDRVRPPEEVPVVIRGRDETETSDVYHVPRAPMQEDLGGGMHEDQCLAGLILLLNDDVVAPTFKAGSHRFREVTVAPDDVNAVPFEEVVALLPSKRRNEAATPAVGLGPAQVHDLMDQWIPHPLKPLPIACFNESPSDEKNFRHWSSPQPNMFGRGPIAR